MSLINVVHGSSSSSELFSVVMLLCSTSELFSSRSSVVMLLSSSAWFPLNCRCGHRLRGFRCTDCSLSNECQCKINKFSVIHDYLYTNREETSHNHPTSTLHPPNIHPTSTPHPPYIHPKSTPHPPHVHPKSTPHPP